MTVSACFLALLIAGIHLQVSKGALNYPNYDESGPHPCQRPCTEGQSPMVCDYEFSIEWFLTLSKACWECPFNLTDCERPHCNPGDGLRRPIITINRQSPGPLIEVCENDTIRVRVHNNLMDGQGISIHWHGIHQKGTPYMDGVGMVTQCLIQYESNFTYEFAASPAGTHFYHSHTGFQRGDGLYGGLVVHSLAADDPHYDLYDHDCAVANGHCEYIMQVTDMTPEVTYSSFLYNSHYRSESSELSALIEGRNDKYLVADDIDPGRTTLTPREIFTVKTSKRYRFRVINAGNHLCSFKISINNHNLTVIAADGMPITPINVEVFGIFPGETYDFIVDADQTVSNYWVKSHGLIDCLFHDAYAEFYYTGAPVTEPNGDRTSDRRGMFLNAILSDLGHPKYSHGPEEDIFTDEIRSAVVEDFSDEVVDITHYIGMDFYDNDYTRFHHPQYYPPDEIAVSRSLFQPVFNNITFHIPGVPVLSQPNDLDPSLVCNKASVDPVSCYQFGCTCVNVEDLPMNQVVEVILVDEGVAFAGGGHPLHLHGNKFRLLGTEKLNTSTSVQTVMELNDQGLLKRNFMSPSYRDTITVPDGGYVVFRMYTDNPGYWLFHCHVEEHLELGQGLLFHVGTADDLPPVPADFPTCGTWP